MRKFVEIASFSGVAITALILVVFTKDYLYTNKIINVSSSALGIDGMIVWFCLMMGIRQLFKSITGNKNT